jgi:EAL domain-containing protein (putative c-di-GMP-specific phosphodiesterase class I)
MSKVSGVAVSGPFEIKREPMTVDDNQSALQEALDALMGAASAPETVMQPARPAVVASPISEAKIATDAEQVFDASSVVLSGPVDENWLELWYQPKIDLRQKCLAGAEALARINHPEHGLLWLESHLASISEDNLALIFERALLTTLSDWSSFGDAGFNLRLAINIPVNLLLTLPIPKLMNENRPRAEHWPGLMVEVTEDQFVRDIAHAREIAGQLRDNGITIAIDDFGAGYSCLATMRELAFAELKVNRNFVKSCATDATNSAICQTAIDLAHRFGSTAVADGIEQIADLQALQIMGCDFGQGTLLSPPMMKERFIDLLQQRMNKGRAPQTSARDSEPFSNRLSA